jgi:hypothetical protein
LSSLTRKAKRPIQKNQGNFIYKKSVTKKLGCSVSELNKRLADRKRKLKAMEENDNGNKE